MDLVAAGGTLVLGKQFPRNHECRHGDLHRWCRFTDTVSTTGFPVPAITETGALPTGITFVDNANGTATIAAPLPP